MFFDENLDYAIVIDEDDPFIDCYGKVMEIKGEKVKVDLDEESKHWFLKSQLMSISKDEYLMCIEEEHRFSQYMAQWEALQNAKDANIDVYYYVMDEDGNTHRVKESDFDNYMRDMQATTNKGSFDTDFLIKETSVKDKKKSNKVEISERTKTLCDSIQFGDEIGFDSYYENMYQLKERINSILDLEIDEDAKTLLTELNQQHEYLYEKLNKSRGRAYKMYCKLRRSGQITQ